MPSQKILEQKQALVAGLAEKFKAATAGVLVKYEGISVEDDTKLRAKLREAGVEYTVVKNTLTGRACDEAGLSEMKQYLGGMTAVAMSFFSYRRWSQGQSVSANSHSERTA